MSDTEKPSEEDQPKLKSILLVEDDADVAEVLVQVISSETPYQPILATDGFQALKMVRNVKPDLFLLDYLLPSMSGLELYDHLHAIEGLEQIPTLFMSANAPTGELEKRRVYYIRKPFELNEFLQAIRELLAE